MRTKKASWPAYYGGRCSACGGNFNKGEMVKWPEGGGGTVVHEECPPSDTPDAGLGPKEREQYREAMCLKCFVVHAPGQEGCQ